MTVVLDEPQQQRLDGAHGPGVSLAMRIVLTAAAALSARGLRSITSAHVDGCLYHGRSSIDFAQRLLGDGARVSVPTTLNVGLIDMLAPERSRLTARERSDARELMELYRRLGCEPTYTCAPYQLSTRPTVGEQIAWAESNAIVFANSVLGARTNRYGDLVDVCAAVCGLVPDAGLHRDDGRLARVVFDVSRLPERLRHWELLAPLVGHIIGARAGEDIAAVVGLPPAIAEDALKALGAAAASSGEVSMFHAVGITPEAPTLEAALGGRAARSHVHLTAEDLLEARRELGLPRDGALSGVAIGTPHASGDELRQLLALLEGRRVHPEVECFVTTSRYIAYVESEAVQRLQDAGVVVARDTCTYVSPMMRTNGPILTNSAKWAYYALANVGADAHFTSLRECVESAVAGEVRTGPVLP